MDDELVAIDSLELIGDYAVRLKFADGLVRELDLEYWIGGAVGRELVDPAVFAQVELTPDRLAITWPNGVHVHSDFLHDEAREIQRR